MPRPDLADRRSALDHLAAAQSGVVTAAQLRALGFLNASAVHRIDTSRIWRRLLPGVYLTHNAPASAHQRRVAAQLYGGADTVITGRAALTVHGSRVAARSHDTSIVLLVPHHRHRSSTGFVVVERTTRWPRIVHRQGLRLTMPARAALDAGRRISDGDDVRALLADVVQSGLAPLESLTTELREGPRRGSRLPRLALEALGAGTRSAPEAALRDAWIESGLPEPLWNPRLALPDGTFLATPDAYVPSAGLAVEVASKEFHFSDADWRRTMSRQSRMTSHGVVVLQYPPSRLRRDRRAEVLREISETLAALGRRELPRIVVNPSA